MSNEVSRHSKVRKDYALANAGGLGLNIRKCDVFGDPNQAS